MNSHSRRSAFVTLVTALVFGSCIVPPVAAADFRVAGYLPEYRAAAFDPDAAAGLTDLILFSAEPAADGGLNLARLERLPWEKLQKYKRAQRVRLVLCVGGWGRSAHFAAVASAPASRAAFAQSCSDICRQRDLDGIDLDWEHPQGRVEVENFGKLLSALRTALAPRGYQLSVTISSSQQLSPAAIKAADWVQVMAYDHAGRHATWDDSVKDVQLQLDRGVPAEKLVLGMPFYGRHRTQRGQTLTYREILARYRPAATVDEVEGIFFNGAATIRRKTEFALQSKLGGVMVWELGQDAPGDDALLNVIRQAVRGTGGAIPVTG